ncbi:hypothetical protein [Chryseobacterium sp. ISL-6]|uniref:hypothetical protein n=1 Tax=Chryseobacterium sp. ISL-6 TaxID=2819143 RepID=UPI002034E426|nr:hypothetical protein [Chryseobacterium sp. ISL-6]
MKKPLLGLSMMAEADFVSAILPLFENNQIEILEWSFDTFYDVEEPEWLKGLLDFYSQNNRLIGHGVYYSLFDAKWTERQEEWLNNLKTETEKRHYNHITEHFGFYEYRKLSSRYSFAGFLELQNITNRKGQTFKAARCCKCSNRN